MTGTHGPNSRTLWGTTQMTNICSPLILGPLGLTDVDCLWPLDILSELAMSSEETLPVGQFFRHPQNNGHFNTNPQFYFFSQRGKKKHAKHVLFPIFSKFTHNTYTYPLINIQKTMENHHFQWVNPRTKWFNGISPSGFPMDPHGRSLPVHVAQLLGRCPSKHNGIAFTRKEKTVHEDFDSELVFTSQFPSTLFIISFHCKGINHQFPFRILLVPLVIDKLWKRGT